MTADGGPRQAARPAASAQRQVRVFARRIAIAGSIVAALLLLGALCLTLEEHVSFWYAFRWAFDSAATVGGFPQPRSTLGQIVVVALVAIGVATLFYALASVAELFVAGDLAELLALRRMKRTIDSLSGHHIVCGFGRVGRQVARDLVSAGAGCVVVDTNGEERGAAESLGLCFVEGDAADDAVLAEAGIARARAIVVCADSDANNVFITLTARELRSDIAIVARAAVEDSERKLRRAGADRVISPYKASGTEMARLALHRQLSGVLDVDPEYRIEEMEVGPACPALGDTVGQLSGGAAIVGLRRGGAFQLQPSAGSVLQRGDVVVAIGTAAALGRLEEQFEEGAERGAVRPW